MLNVADIESALRPLLPAGDRAAALAQLLAAVAAGALDPAQAQARLAADPALAEVLRALAGQSVTAGQSVISFGSGNQLGDVSIGDVAGRDLFKLALTVVAQPAAPALHQLRAPVGDFTGRQRELEQLVQSLTGGAAAAISGLRGMGGIGKTELAYAVAARLGATFPDAQLRVELRGATDNPLSAVQALQTLIRAFERERKLPDELGELQALYCALLAGKRTRPKCAPCYRRRAARC
jgi:hypothetical protein